MIETTLLDRPVAAAASASPSDDPRSLGERVIQHALRGLTPARRAACEAAYAAQPAAYFDRLDHEIACTMAASRQSLQQCLRDLDAFNALTPEVENDAWYDQPRAFTSMHLDALLIGFARRRLECTSEQVLRHAPAATEGVDVLEVGSGSGFLASLLSHAAPHWRLSLVDRSLAAVRFASALHAQRGTGDKVRCLRGDLDALPTPDASVDVVIAAEVLEHAPDPARSIAEMLRILRPGGRLAISVPVDLDIAMHPTVFRNEAEILHFFESFGLECLESTCVAPDPQLDAIADVFPGFAGCVNAVFRRRPRD